MKPQTPQEEPSVPRTRHFTVIGCAKCHRTTPHRLLGPIQFNRRSQDAKAPLKCLICRKISTHWLHKDGKDAIELTREDPREQRPETIRPFVMHSSSQQRQAQQAEQMREIVAMTKIFPAFGEAVHEALDKAFGGMPDEAVTPPSD